MFVELKNAVIQFVASLITEDAARMLRFQPSRAFLLAEIPNLLSRLVSDIAMTGPLLAAVATNASHEKIWSALYDLITASTVVQQPTPAVTQTPDALTSGDEGSKHDDTNNDDTLIIHNSASLEGDEQTHQLLDPRIWEEIMQCTHRGVAEFLPKYFEGQKWSQEADSIVTEAMSRYQNNGWVDFPKPPAQAPMLNWFFGLQGQFFANQRLRFYTTHNTPLAGSKARRKLDLFVKQNKNEYPDAVRANWEDVCVIGELKETADKDKELIIQLAGYAREVFASQPTRHFLHGFTVRGSQMELWMFDRSGPFSSSKFDIQEHPEQFIRVIAGYLLMGDKELGFNTFIERRSGKQFITIKDARTKARKKLELDTKPIALQRAIVCRGTTCYRAKPVKSKSQSWNYVVKFSWRSAERRAEGELLELARQRQVEGVAKLVSHRDLISIAELRTGLTFGTHYQYPSDDATSRASNPGTQTTPLHRQALGQGPSNPTSQKRPAPTTSHRTMRKKSKLSGEVSAEAGEVSADADEVSADADEVSADAGWVSAEAGEVSADADEVSADAGEVSAGAGKVSAEAGEASDAQVGTLPKCKTDLTDAHSMSFRDRIFSCLTISPAGRPLRNYNNVKELLEAFRDAIRGHQSLYDRGNILHRDVSENNLIIIDDPRLKREWKGMLIDLDLGKERGSEPSGARFRTGTMQFMAIEVLNGLHHTYRHDLESFFYVLLWICIRRGWESYAPSGIRNSFILASWYTGNYDDIARAKKAFMLKSDFRKILDAFPPSFFPLKPTADKIRGILFPIKDGDMFVGTPDDPAVLYDPIIQALEEAVEIL